MVNNLIVSNTYGMSFSGFNSPNFSTSVTDWIGLAMTGPIPDLISTSTPMAGSGVIISLYKIAASTSYCSTGNLVT
ncbi:Uncharacterised protein [Chlamydia trachomatis]|nr:Uncharacterised protein [Chlamydia trachomatis]